MNGNPEFPSFARLFESLRPWLDQVVIVGGWARTACTDCMRSRNHCDTNRWQLSTGISLFPRVSSHRRRDLSAACLEWDIHAQVLTSPTRLLLSSNTATNPIWNDKGRFPVVAHLAHYMFHPITNAVVVALLVLRIIRLRCVGFWTVIHSFLIGGLSATIILALR